MASQPKKEDNSEYLAGLSTQEKEIADLFAQVRASKKENTLIEMVRSKKLSPTATNKEGRTALGQAADCEFSLKCIKELIKLGSNVDHMDNSRMTVLATAYQLGNVDTFEYLVKEAKAVISANLRKEIMDDGNNKFIKLLPMSAKEKKK